jgi:transposase
MCIVCRYFWYTDPSTGKLQNGALKSILSEVNRGKSTVMRTMKEFREMCNQQETLTPDLNETFGQRTGRPSELTEELKAEIKDVNERTGGRLTILELSNRIQVSVSTMRRYLISMEAERKSTWVKPKLSYQQQMERLRFVLNLRHGNRARFKSLRNVIMLVRIYPGDDMPDPISDPKHTVRNVFYFFCKVDVNNFFICAPFENSNIFRFTKSPFKLLFI